MNAATAPLSKGVMVMLDEHHCAQYEFREEASSDTKRDPGWYLWSGFRGHCRTQFAGPFATYDLAHLAWLRIKLIGYAPLDMARRSSVQPIVTFDPYVIIVESVLRVGRNVRIDSFTKLECGEGMLIGHNVHIASYCHLGIGGGLTIMEDGSSFGSGAKLISGSNVPGIGHGCSAVAPDAKFSRSFVHVKRNATLFAGAIALPGVTIGENAVLAAGAVATKDVPANEIWAGVPAKYIARVKDDDAT